MTTSPVDTTGFDFIPLGGGGYAKRLNNGQIEVKAVDLPIGFMGVTLSPGESVILEPTISRD